MGLSFTNKIEAAYNLYYEAIYGMIFNRIHDHIVTDDLTQDVFVAFINKFEEIKNHRSWLLGTARLRVYEYYRSKKMNIDIAEVDNEMQMTYVNAFRDTRLLIEEVLHDPESFINEHDRIIFDLKNVYCYTFMEIAEALGIARHKVHYRYYKITQHLTGQFKKRGINSLEDLL